MKYKAIICDIDGTLTLPGEKVLSDKVIRAVVQAHDYIYVSIATGRVLDNPAYDARPIIDTLELTGPCILDQGTQIYDPQKDKIILEISLDVSSVVGVIDVFHDHPVPLYFFDGQKDLLYDFSIRPEKIVSFFTQDVDSSLIDILEKKLRTLPHIALHRMLGRTKGTESIEVTHISASKQHGIEEVAKILHIDTHEIIGVGDGYNDFPLLMACGLKIAMGNAVPELKAIADFVAPSVEDDGVATVIEKFILNNPNE
jgi:HAD superfamily hydrolase (TIGR01484 family)